MYSLQLVTNINLIQNYSLKILDYGKKSRFY